MAKSQSHTLGEFIGDFFENLMKRPIREFAEKNGLYFDSAGPRKVRKGKKVTWTDIHGSRHDLDFVLEKGGTEETIGDPVAFIELAWRRYTKHSKNKVQEIAGAVNPLYEKYKLGRPFKGAILSGQFTGNALEQLKKDNFHVLYIPFDKLVRAFRLYGFDICFDEDTKESDLRKKYVAVSKKTSRQLLESVREEIFSSCKIELDNFIAELSASYRRKVKSVRILPLHGKCTEVMDVRKAIEFINEYSTIPVHHELQYIEVFVSYNNGTSIHCQFKEKVEAVDFLERLR